MNSLFISWLSIISQQHSQLHSSSDWKSDLLSLKKSDIFWPAFFLPTFFRWLLHTFLPRFPYFFCHVRKKKFFFTTFLPTANTINHVLPARVPVLHMFRFPSSSDSATPTTNFWIPTIQLIPRHLANSVHNFCPTTNFQTATTVTATCYSTGKQTKL